MRVSVLALDVRGEETVGVCRSSREIPGVCPSAFALGGCLTDSDYVRSYRRDVGDTLINA